MLENFEIRFDIPKKLLLCMLINHHSQVREDERDDRG